MSDEVFLLWRAQNALSKIRRRDYERLRATIRDLGAESKPADCRKLSGREGWRLRVGDYRVIYEVDEAREEVTVRDVGHRRDTSR